MCVLYDSYIIICTCVVMVVDDGSCCSWLPLPLATHTGLHTPSIIRTHTSTKGMSRRYVCRDYIIITSSPTSNMYPDSVGHFLFVGVLAELCCGGEGTLVDLGLSGGGEG